MPVRPTQPSTSPISSAAKSCRWSCGRCRVLLRRMGCFPPRRTRTPASACWLHHGWASVASDKEGYRRDCSSSAVLPQNMIRSILPSSSDIRLTRFRSSVCRSIINIIPEWSMAVLLAVTVTRPGSVRRWLVERLLLSAGLRNGWASRDALVISSYHCGSDGCCWIALPFPTILDDVSKNCHYNFSIPLKHVTCHRI